LIEIIIQKIADDIRGVLRNIFVTWRL